MRFFFKTDYNYDINLFRDGVDRFWYGLLIAALLLAPFVLEDFWLGEISYVFILSIVGIGLMLLTGYTGQGRSAMPPSSASVPIPIRSCSISACRSGSRSRRPPCCRR